MGLRVRKHRNRMRPRTGLHVWLLAHESQSKQKPVRTFWSWLVLSMKQCQRERTSECSSYQTNFRPPSLFQEKMSCGNWTPLKDGILPVESDGKWRTIWEVCLHSFTRLILQDFRIDAVSIQLWFFPSSNEHIYCGYSVPAPYSISISISLAVKREWERMKHGKIWDTVLEIWSYVERGTFQKSDCSGPDHTPP